MTREQLEADLQLMIEEFGEDSFAAEIYREALRNFGTQSAEDLYVSGVVNEPDQANAVPKDNL